MFYQAPGTQTAQAPQNNTVELPDNTVVTPEARLSFFKCYKPEPNLNGDPVYSTTLLFPKATTDLTALNAAIEAAIQLGVKNKWQGYRPPNLKLPLGDGDVYAAQKPDKRQPYVGHWYINSSQNPEYGKPVVLDERKVRSENPQDVQSGDYAIAVLEFVPFSNKSQGITTIPKVIRKTRTGERFTPGVTESDALAALGGEVSAEIAAAMPQAPAVPSGPVGPANPTDISSLL